MTDMLKTVYPAPAKHKYTPLKLHFAGGIKKGYVNMRVLSIYIYCLNPVKRTFGQVPRKRKNKKQDRKG